MIRAAYRLATSLGLCAAALIGCDRRPGNDADTIGTASGAESSSSPISSSQSFIPLSGDSVGPLPVVADRADLGRIGRVARDTSEEGDEGMIESVAVVVLDGDTVRAVLDDSSRVHVYYLRSPRFQTRDSLGVGTSLARLLRIPGVHAFTGEGQVLVRLPQHCGLSFRLSDPEDLGDGPDSIGPPALRRLPERTHVSEVLVFGCRPAERPAARPGER
jgi:hypothetical protein